MLEIFIFSMKLNRRVFLMKGRKFGKRLLMLLMIVISICGNSLVVSARDDVDSVVYISENAPELLSICTRANSTVGKEILTYTGNDGLLSFSNKSYTELTIDEREAFMETALSLVKSSGLGSQAKNKAYNFIADQDSTTSASVKLLRTDASADFAEAAAMFKPFGSFAGVVLGLVSLFIFMFVGLSIAFDLSYLVLPGFKVILEKGNTTKRPRFVSREAFSSAIDSEDSIASHDYKGCITLYLKRRVPALILMSICLGYLISGKIYDIIVFFIDSFSWIFQQ